MGETKCLELGAGRSGVRLALAEICLGLFLLSAPAALLAADMTVAAQTTDCSGNIGFTSFNLNKLYKIQQGPCPDPGDPGKKLNQVLLKSDSGLYQYDVLWVTEAESRQIMEQIKNINEARLQDLSGPDVVIEREVIERKEVIERAPEETSSGDAPETATRDSQVDPEPPSIEMMDPPLGSTRSMTRVITASDAEFRTIVGRARSGSGILSLTINGEKQTVDDQGIFSMDVPIRNARTPVSIVAVDKAGRNSTLDMELVRERPQQVEAGNDNGGTDVFGRYHALIIANKDYESLTDLSTPENDANAVASILGERYGFEIVTLFNATRYDILTALNDMRRTLTEKDNLLIYFAGHGAYDDVNNRGHWLPVDAEYDSTANWVSTTEITDVVNAMSARHVLVMADSCYSGALSRSENTNLDPGMSPDLRSQWLRAMAQAKSRHVLTSGGVKPVVDDAGNGHSVFANALIEVLQDVTGAIEGSELFRRIEGRVADRARDLALDQTPLYAQLKNTGHEFGEFILMAGRKASSGQP